MRAEEFLFACVKTSGWLLKSLLLDRNSHYFFGMFLVTCEHSPKSLEHVSSLEIFKFFSKIVGKLSEHQFEISRSIFRKFSEEY